MKEDVSRTLKHEIKITNPQKLYWQHPPFSKLDLLDYYQRIVPVILPHLKNHPVTLKNFPSGIKKIGFYVRDRQKNVPRWIKSFAYEPITEIGKHQMIVIENKESLIWFVNKGTVEFHTWSSKISEIENPIWAIFDLDPGEKAHFKEVLTASLYLREYLNSIGLNAFPKTSGMTGLHVFVPINPVYTFEYVRNWVKKVAGELSQKYGDYICSPSGPTHLGKKVTIDAAQNAIGKNTATAYTVRANACCPTISTPLNWKEIEEGRIQPTDFTPKIVLDRVKNYGDLFKQVLSLSQELP